MSSEVEALGDLATAGMAAVALDPPDGSKVVGNGVCANCGAPLTGSFCASCGQKAHVHRSLVHVGEELLHGITHFDGKAWTTLPMLVFRPGKLTRDYIEGKRARYIAPVPLFLLIVFLMFFVFSFVHITDNSGGVVTNASGQPMSQAEAKAALQQIDAKLAANARDVAAAAPRPEPGELAALKGVRTALLATRGPIEARANGRVATPLDVPAEIAREIRQGNPKVNLGDKTLNEKAELALKNPELVLYKIQGKAYKLSFLLVPMSLPWLWLMFAWKRDVRLYDHAIFALYSISFMSLLFVIGSAALAQSITTGWFWLPLLVAPFLHMFAQLKGTYALGNASALWRTAALSFASVITLSLYSALMIALGVLD